MEQATIDCGQRITSSLIGRKVNILHTETKSLKVIANNRRIRNNHIIVKLNRCKKGVLRQLVSNIFNWFCCNYFLSFMPLRKKTRPYTKENVSKVPNQYGVYEILDTKGNIRYIGHGSLRDRLNTHFIGDSNPVPGASKFRFETTGSKTRAEQRERAELMKHVKSKGKLPSSNKKL